MTVDQATTPTGEENRADIPIDPAGVVFDEGQVPEPETNQQPVEGTDEKKQTSQDAINKKFNRLTFEKYEAQRKFEEIEKKNQALEAKLNKPYGDSPPVRPDPLDTDYDQKVVDYEKQKEIYDRQLGAEEYKKQISAEKKQTEVHGLVSNMYEKAGTYGISQFELSQAEKIVSDNLNSPEVAMFLLKHDDSPLIVKHLANSGEDLAKRRGMTPIDAALYIDKVVSQSAQALKPKTSTAPAPLTIPDGKGAGEKQNEYLKDVNFE